MEARPQGTRRERGDRVNNLGYQPPARSTGRYDVGRLLFHAIGCRVDGGQGLPPGVCLKCHDGGIVNQYYRTLMRVDMRVA